MESLNHGWKQKNETFLHHHHLQHSEKKPVKMASHTTIQYITTHIILLGTSKSTTLHNKLCVEARAQLYNLNKKSNKKKRQPRYRNKLLLFLWSVQQERTSNSLLVSDWLRIAVVILKKRKKQYNTMHTTRMCKVKKSWKTGKRRRKSRKNGIQQYILVFAFSCSLFSLLFPQTLWWRERPFSSTRVWPCSWCYGVLFRVRSFCITFATQHSGHTACGRRLDISLWPYCIQSPMRSHILFSTKWIRGKRGKSGFLLGWRVHSYYEREKCWVESTTEVKKNLTEMRPSEKETGGKYTRSGELQEEDGSRMRTYRENLGRCWCWYPLRFATSRRLNLSFSCYIYPLALPLSHIQYMCDQRELWTVGKRIK